MHMRLTISALLLALASAGCSQPAAQAETEPASGQEVEAAILAANEGFYTALNTLFQGDAGPMLEVWSHEDDVTYLPPFMERIAGWDAVKASFEQQAALKLEGKFEPHDVVVHMLSPTVALVVTTEVGEDPTADGGTTEIHIRATKLFRLEGDTWKLFYDHADLIPGLAAESS